MLLLSPCQVAALAIKARRATGLRIFQDMRDVLDKHIFTCVGDEC